MRIRPKQEIIKKPVRSRPVEKSRPRLNFEAAHKVKIAAHDAELEADIRKRQEITDKIEKEKRWRRRLFYIGGGSVTGLTAAAAFMAEVIFPSYISSEVEGLGFSIERGARAADPQHIIYGGAGYGGTAMGASFYDTLRDSVVNRLYEAGYVGYGLPYPDDKIPAKDLPAKLPENGQEKNMVLIQPEIYKATLSEMPALGQITTVIVDIPVQECLLQVGYTSLAEALKAKQDVVTIGTFPEETGSYIATQNMVSAFSQDVQSRLVLKPYHTSGALLEALHNGEIDSVSVMESPQPFYVSSKLTAHYSSFVEEVRADQSGIDIWSLDPEDLNQTAVTKFGYEFKRVTSAAFGKAATQLCNNHVLLIGRAPETIEDSGRRHIVKNIQKALRESHKRSPHYDSYDKLSALSKIYGDIVFGVKATKVTDVTHENNPQISHWETKDFKKELGL